MDAFHVPDLDGAVQGGSDKLTSLKGASVEAKDSTEVGTKTIDEVPLGQLPHVHHLFHRCQHVAIVTTKDNQFVYARLPVRVGSWRKNKNH